MSFNRMINPLNDLQGDYPKSPEDMQLERCIMLMQKSEIPDIEESILLFKEFLSKSSIKYTLDKNDIIYRKSHHKQKQ